jgi:hypothetical protein
VLLGEHDGDSFGWQVEAADADGDGRVEVVVGADTANEGAGRVYLVPGDAL